MSTSETPTDEDLLAAFSERLRERSAALAQAASVLAEMRAVNAKLEAAESLKGRFLSNIRNEINNPLTTLRGFAAALAGNPDLSREQIASIAAAMHRDVSDLSFQMQNIFAAADFEAGCTAPDFARANLSHLIAGVVGDLCAIAAEKQVQVVVSADESLCACTDPAKLALLLANLLRNAIEFACSAVSIRLHQDGESVRLEVEDDGPGIPADATETIFDRFVQISEGSTKSHPGHGLGLSVARACAESIGGSLAALATEGTGACFRLEFPVGELAASREEADSANEFLFEPLETF